MALGGGTWLVQNKVLPGSYINFVSIAFATATLSDRGYASMPLELDWGVENEVFEVTNADFQKNSLKIFGYEYTNDKLRGLRDLFRNAHTLYAYRLNGGGVKASNDYATAKYPGIRGNDIKVVIQENIDDDSLWDVTTYIGDSKIETQTVEDATKLIDNDFVTFKIGAVLKEEAGVPLENGTNGTVNGASHQAYLDKIEPYSFNTFGVDTTDTPTRALYEAFTKRMRDEVGKKFQCVIYRQNSDYEGVLNLENKVKNVDCNESALVYWLVGASAECPVNKSLLNRVYDGEFDVDVKYTQAQLIKNINDGKFTFHQVNDKVRVLNDINSLVTETDTKGYIFKENQTIRVIDNIANDIAVIFNTKYLGVVPNDEGGRASLWADIVKYMEQLQDIRCIENFADDDVVVSQGDTKKAVVVDDAIQIINTMEKLYMTCVCR